MKNIVKLFNTLTRKLEVFKPINPPNVGIYSCGPTVYWNQHIGHMYAYTQWDILVRFLRYMDYRVKWVMNITDVGHMTSNEDIGEDKMEKGARREGTSVWKIADKYIKQFKESMDLLNIHHPDIFCRATEHIQEQIELIKRIEASGFTYRTKTGIVFDTSKFPDYAKFARLDLSRQSAGARVEVDSEKKYPWDFLLWVTNQPTHVMQWDSPWGRGFPGWHIECTAMSVKYLGEQFDIHTGGVEHIPVHHTNEIAQAYGAFGRRTASYWLHNGWLMLKGEKISKSLGNMITVADLIASGHDPLVMRYLIFNSHYRQGMDFTWEALDGAATALRKLRQLIVSWRSNKKRSVLSAEKLQKIDSLRVKFIGFLANDLNISGALAVVWETAKSSIPDPDKYDLLLNFDQVLGLKLEEVSLGQRETKTPPLVARLAKEREKLRKEKRWSEADEVRKKIESLGWKIGDFPDGPKVRKK